jgi:HD-GYP domain-containing protein (c-di-GMP phosphodiesterase class II)
MTSGPGPLHSAHGAADDARERMLGQMLIRRLHGLIRSARIYDENNRTYTQQLEEFLSALSVSVEEETSLVAMGDSFYVNGVRMRPSPSQMALFRALQEEFAVRGLAGLRFLDGLNARDLTAFLRLLVAVRTAEEGSGLPETAAAAGILRIIPVKASDLGASGPETEESQPLESLSERDRAREIMAAAIEGTHGLLRRTVRTGKPALRQARRILQPVVDSVQKQEFSIVGLTALKNHDEYTFAHCVNVGVLSIAIGQRLGLPRSALANVGVAGLMHDLGKIAVPPEVLRKPGALTPAEWRSIQRHPIEGVRFVSRTSGLSTLMLDAMLVEFEHHMHPGGGGYPELPKPRALGAFTRIVAVADVFDALTAHRAYRKRPFSGYEALSQILNSTPGRYDPAVLWAFVRTVGLYPAGTIMETASGHAVISLSPNPNDVYRPYCRVLRTPDGFQVDGDAAPTWDPMPARETVLRVIPPGEWPEESDYLLAA